MSGKRKQTVKPVKAWTFTYGDRIMPEWMKSTKEGAERSAHLCSFPTQVIRVEIRPLTRKAKRP